MAITQKDLKTEVANFNKKYCRNTKHELFVQGAYGGYQVQLRGKKRLNGNGYRGVIGSGVVDVTRGFDSAKNTLMNLYKTDAQGRLKSTINYYEKSKR
jgi:hypothetical protein